MEAIMTKRTYNEIVFRLTYSPQDLPTFETQAACDDFFKALGRMVHYAMQDNRQEQDEVRIVNAHMTTNPLEVCAAYHAALPAAEIGEDGYPYYYRGAQGKLSAALDPLIEQSKNIHRPFVMAAVQHQDGTFGFHS